MGNYTTIQGDMWDMISYRLYGKEYFMHLLIAANPACRDIAIFPANCVLTVLAITPVTAVIFPPWRRRSA